ncbi:uncharacterized protein LOC106868355 [Octopus bimaculoides]|uniref:DUF7041 domain-containing protein n=1 Tax=Octopus bimaculoides TaxID=37653 RepID=A0A0L8HWM6_OCTBM|nr:uncharacterized protein LOC106868355 [Octopus bimaculoides]|eukprot:XP_014769055.1 PREDICTED: uncharacterized protein LOC106868355 [Octopus bimaculoides]
MTFPEPNPAANTSPTDMTFEAAITWRIPPFWTHDPVLWFHHIEAQFSSHRVLSDASRLSHVIGSLSLEIMNVVRDLIMAPHGSVSYDTFKTTLINRTSESQRKRLHQLPTSEKLSNRTPSQFLRRIKQLLGDESLRNKVFKQLFLQRLPSNTQVVLASTRESTSIEELAELADKIAEVPHRFSTVSTVTPTAPTTNPFLSPISSSEIADLRSLMTQQAAQIQTLTTQIQALSLGNQCRSSSRSRRSSSQSHSPSASRNSHDTCWYHRKFGTLAQKCTTPCSFASPSSGNGTARN